MKKLLLITVMLSLLTGCTFPAATTAPSTKPNTSTEATVPTATTTSTTTPLPTETDPTSPTTTVAVETPLPTGSVTFSIYRPDETAEGFISETVTMDPMVPQVIIQILAEDGILDMGVTLNSIAIRDGILYLDLNEAFLMQVYTMGVSGERMLFGCLVNTFLSAYNCESAMVTVDGQVIRSGHVDYTDPLTFFS